MHESVHFMTISRIRWFLFEFYSRFNRAFNIFQRYTRVVIPFNIIYDDIEDSPQFRQYLRIDYFGNLWRYPWVFHFAFDKDIQELIIFDNNRHLNSLLILPISSISSSFVECCTRDIEESHHISPIDDVTIFSIFLWLFCFWWHPQLIRFMTTISSYSRFWCVWQYFAFLNLSVFRRYTSISFILDHSW